MLSYEQAPDDLRRPLPHHRRRNPRPRREQARRPARPLPRPPADPRAGPPPRRPLGHRRGPARPRRLPRPGHPHPRGRPRPRPRHRASCETETPPPWAGQTATYAAAAVMDLIRSAHTTIVFINTRAQAEVFFQHLWAANDEALPIGLHHGSLSREARARVEAAMAAGELRAVVATGSLDLGIDWGDVDLVIQVGAPKNVKRLVQRIGRANHRYNAPSRAVLVPSNRFELLECRAALDAVAERTLDGEPRGPGPLDVLCQHILLTACAAPFDADALYAEVTHRRPLPRPPARRLRRLPRLRRHRRLRAPRLRPLAAPGREGRPLAAPRPAPRPHHPDERRHHRRHREARRPHPRPRRAARRGRGGLRRHPHPRRHLPDRRRDRPLRVACAR